MSTAARTTADLPAPSLGVLAARGSAWTFIGYAIGQALRLGSHLILARLLFPEVFGLMALVAVFLQGLQMFSDVGIGPSIIQNKRGEDRAFLNTAWTIQVVRGVVLWLIALTVAWPYAALYGEPQLGPLIAVAGMSAFIAGFNSTGLFSANRHLALGRITILDLISQVVSVTVMIVWAMLHASPWALVAGGITAAIVKMAFSHLLWSGSDRLQWDRSAARALIHFGKWIFATSASNFISSQGHRLILGAYLVMADLGVYAVAYYMIDAIRGAVSKLSHAVMFPALSRTARDNPKRLPSVYYRARMVTDLAILPPLGMLAVLGSTVVTVLYDERYAEAGWMLQILAIRAAVSCVSLFGGACLLALGNPRYAFGVTCISIVWVFAGVPLVWPHFHLHGAVWVIATANILPALFVAYGLHRYRILAPRREILPIALFTLGVAIGLVVQPPLSAFFGASS